MALSKNIKVEHWFKAHFFDGTVSLDLDGLLVVWMDRA
jgi:hypothetical protein